jgi:hypothetical protein
MLIEAAKIGYLFYFPDLHHMPRKKTIEYKESPYAKDLVKIMCASPGPN